MPVLNKKMQNSVLCIRQIDNLVPFCHGSGHFINFQIMKTQNIPMDFLSSLLSLIDPVAPDQRFGTADKLII